MHSQLIDHDPISVLVQLQSLTLTRSLTLENHGVHCGRRGTALTVSSHLMLSHHDVENRILTLQSVGLPLAHPPSQRPLPLCSLVICCEDCTIPGPHGILTGRSKPRPQPHGSQ